MRLRPARRGSPSRVMLLIVAVAALPIAGVAKNVVATDVVLKPAAAFSAIDDENVRSAALFTEMGKVIESPRCLNCHPRTDRPNQGEGMRPHNPPVFRGVDGRGVAGLECSSCHGPRNVAFTSGEGSVPGNPEWHLAPKEMAWEGKTLREICGQIKDPRRNGGRSLANLIAHNGHDSLVGWAWNPGAGRKPAPGTQAAFGALTKAWVASGARCPD